MCGIVGLVEREGSRGDELRARAVAMSDRLVHRGPDAAGVWSDPSVGVALGHRRLSIVERSPLGAQPMCSADGRYVLTFNGEIFNFIELRRELEARGHSFRGGSDTEVMLAAFSAWGIEASLKRFIGMFAFGLWDRSERVLTLARDRLGEKPLYYGYAGCSFLFASELKAMTAHPAWTGEIDRDVLTIYFRANCVPGPYSIYAGIRKLGPGTFAQLHLGHMDAKELPAPVPYWSLAEAAEKGTRQPFSGSETEAIDTLDKLLGDAVRSQMIADVPLGGLLSGGVDSSTIVALMQEHSKRPIRTFTVGFRDPAYNEADYARAVAKHIGTDHTETLVDAAAAMEVIPRLPVLYDEPFADSSQIPSHLVAQIARRYVTVCLTGDAGDEIFGGYNRQVQLLRLWRVLRHVPHATRAEFGRRLGLIPARLLDTLPRLGKLGRLGDQIQKLATIMEVDDPEQMYVALASWWQDPSRLVLGAPEIGYQLTDRTTWPRLPTLLQRMLYVETVTSLPDDILTKVDRAAMGVSLETRVPLLDVRVVEFAWSLPDKLRVRGSKGKWILRKLLNRYVPRKLTQSAKTGFGIPLDAWLRTSLRDWAENLLDAKRVRQDGYLDVDLVRQTWDEHQSGRRNLQHKLWSVLMFHAWLDETRHRPGTRPATEETHVRVMGP